MKSKIQQILDKFLGVDDNDTVSTDETDITIATSVLFIELALADFKITTEEESKLRNSLKTFFNLTDEEVENLITTAKEKREQRNDIWLFTNKIKEKFNRNQKRDIIELLWELVYADGHMDKYEEALMRKISELLGLTHGEMIEAKLKASKKNG